MSRPGFILKRAFWCYVAYPICRRTIGHRLFDAPLEPGELGSRVRRCRICRLKVTDR